MKLMKNNTQSYNESWFKRMFDMDWNSYYKIQKIDQIYNDESALLYLKHISASLYLEKSADTFKIQDALHELQSNTADLLLMENSSNRINSGFANLQIGRYILLNNIEQYIKSLIKNNINFKDTFLPSSSPTTFLPLKNTDDNWKSDYDNWKSDCDWWDEYGYEEFSDDDE